MGNKISPQALRSSIKKNWISRYNQRNFNDKLILDIFIRNILRKILIPQLVSKIFCEILEKNIIITIIANKTGLVIGKKGCNIKKIKSILKKKGIENVYILVKKESSTRTNINNLLNDLFTKIKYREKYNTIIEKILNFVKNKIKGIKIIISGRINGSEIAKKEIHKNGKIPLNTLYNNIQINKNTLKTKYGIIGIKIILCYEK